MNTYKRDYVKNDKNVEIFTIDNFVKEEECDYLSAIIQKHSVRSTVAGYGNEQSVTSDARTSSTSTLSPEDPIVKIIDQRMADELQIPLINGESFQGQIYTAGQEFKDHTDYFTGDSYINHCLHSGQRTWTFMLYLNDVDSGGETEFPNLKKKIKPKKGMAVVWKNSDGTDKEYVDTLHAGRPVKKGKKIIVTKWFREKPWDMAEDIRLAKEYHENKNKVTIKEEVKDVKIEKIDNSIILTDFTKLPRLTEKGFKVTKVPPNTWKFIQEVYTLLKNNKIQENWKGIEEFIHNKEGLNNNIEMFNMDVCPRIKEMIQSELKCIHDVFIDHKEELEPVWIYGIRSYTNGSILEPHYDRPNTHHISSIVIVDKQVKEDWPLQIQDHEGNWHDIYTEPGDMILYESAICKHGRIKPLNGDFYRNFFVHFKLKNYTVII